MTTLTREKEKTGDFETETHAKARTRAQVLADRIEEGAAGLAAFAEGLSEAEWRTPVSATDRRPVGVVVHHVASVYPIEIDFARTIASGEAITEVTWEVVAGVKAKHADEQADATKAATLELLRRNSREAADAVRAFTDDELDRAAPFSLSFGALSLRSSSLRTTPCGTAGITWRVSGKLWAGDSPNSQRRDCLQFDVLAGIELEAIRTHA